MSINSGVYNGIPNPFSSALPIHTQVAAKTISRYPQRVASVQKALNIIKREANTHFLSGMINDDQHTAYHFSVVEFDVAKALEAMKGVRLIHNEVPKREIMKMLRAIRGINKQESAGVSFLVYSRPSLFKRRKSRKYLSAQGFEFLDGLAAMSPRFAEFLKAYDSKAMRKRAKIECTQLALGILPASFEEDILKNAPKLKELYEKEKAEVQARLQMQQQWLALKQQNSGQVLGVANPQWANVYVGSATTNHMIPTLHTPTVVPPSPTASGFANIFSSFFGSRK